MQSLPKVTAVLITRETSWPSDARLDMPFDEVLLETECVGVHRRFELALKARNPHIYIQDDDCFVNAARLMAAYNELSLTYCITPGHKKIYDELCGSRMCLIGWGAMFPIRMAYSYLNLCGAYAHKFGEAVPSHEADRVFTWAADLKAPIITAVQQYRRTRAMSRDNRDHYASRDRMLGRLKELTNG